MERTGRAGEVSKDGRQCKGLTGSDCDCPFPEVTGHSQSRLISEGVRRESL